MTDFEDAMLEVSLHNLTAAVNKHANIDYKAIAIITISGVLISFLAGGTLLWGTLGSGIVAKSLFLLCLFSFFVTILISVQIMEPREYKDVSTRDIINELCKKESDPQVSELVGTVANVEDERQNICDEKAEQLWNAVRVLQISISLMIFYAAAALFRI